MLNFLKAAIGPLFRIFFSVEYHGIENVPLTGPAIIAGNHPSYLDPILVALPVRRRIRFMAWDALFKVPLLGPLIRALGAFPVDIRKGRGEAAFLRAVEVLKRGEALGIFPEGQRSEQGPMGELRAGVARLALETGAPIVPVTIGGASRAWPRWKLLPRPAKIIVRYHKPILLSAAERAERKDDRDFQRQIMGKVATSINRSLTPALRGAESWERWYRQPPSHIRSYEWAPLIAATVATFVALHRNLLARHWLNIWLPVVAYYLYLTADFYFIKQVRTAKWLRNSMPVWLILAWHYPLTQAIGVPAGAMNGVLVLVTLAAFFPFFYEDYYTLQKFVRGLVVVYYFSLLLLVGWPHPLGLFMAMLGFIALFGLRHQTIYYPATVTVVIVVVTAAIYLTGSFSWRLFIYAGLSAAALLYLQTFLTVAYDIRRAGDVRAEKMSVRRHR
ncbi:MAG TPA: lysophospholipid acyltransferase family protein [Blastocatellia bacterium]|nr:lysophospholipid acyltransferase family protein [Blastocatellia bacterium]